MEAFFAYLGIERDLAESLSEDSELSSGSWIGFVLISLVAMRFLFAGIMGLIEVWRTKK